MTRDIDIHKCSKHGAWYTQYVNGVPIKIWVNPNTAPQDTTTTLFPSPCNKKRPDLDKRGLTDFLGGV